MRIIIAGAGEVGFHLASMLASQSQDIYLIDNNEERLEYARTHLDIFTIKGDSKSIKVLEEANVKSANLLIAVTSSEETNVLISILGKKMGAKKTIARVSNNEFLNSEKKKIFKELGIDSIISPTELASKEIRRLIDHSALIESFDFEEGKLSLIGLILDNNSPIIGKTVKEVAEANPEISFIPIAIQRDIDTFIPRGNSTFHAKDTIHIIMNKKNIDALLKITGKKDLEIKKVMILGGSRIGTLTAELLEKKYKVTIIEKDKNKCFELAEKLSNCLIINADGTDVSILEEEGIADTDAFISVTGDSETNIMSSLVAKKHNVKKTIAQVENIYYINLSHNIGIDTLINKKMIAASNIFRYVRKGQVSALANLHGVDAEIIEYEVNEGSKVTKDIIRNLKFPEKAMIAGVIREDKGIIPLGGFQIQARDKVVVFSFTEAIKNVEKFFN